MEAHPVVYHAENICCSVAIEIAKTKVLHTVAGGLNLYKESVAAVRYPPCLPVRPKNIGKPITIEVAHGHGRYGAGQQEDIAASGVRVENLPAGHASPRNHELSTAEGNHVGAAIAVEIAEQ